MNNALQPVIAERTLIVVSRGSTQTARVRIFAPRLEGENWSCAYEIDWPSAIRRNNAGGLDSVQALFLALQMIGAELYAGKPTGVSEVYWIESGGGVGFPLPGSLRDQAAGEDRLM